jgi:hypothetical protein
MGTNRDHWDFWVEAEPTQLQTLACILDKKGAACGLQLTSNSLLDSLLQLLKTKRKRIGNQVETLNSRGLGKQHNAVHGTNSWYC